MIERVMDLNTLHGTYSHTHFYSEPSIIKSVYGFVHGQLHTF